MAFEKLTLCEGAGKTNPKPSRDDRQESPSSHFPVPGVILDICSDATNMGLFLYQGTVREPVLHKALVGVFAS